MISQALKCLLFVVALSMLLASSLVAYWKPNGSAICTGVGLQASPRIVSDGFGGAIVTWYEYRSGNYDIYAQRVNASGVVQWTADGVVLCTATWDQEDPVIVSDGAGGAIVTWEDSRSGQFNYDIYAQRVNASGVVQWTTNGVPLCTATGDQQRPTITSNGAGDAIVTWQDFRSGNYDIYAQRVNASGAVQWTADGVALCTATGDQQQSTITSDGAGGAIVTWWDSRSGNYDIYAQRVNISGAVQWTADGVALCTATGDQQQSTITSDGAGGAIVTWWDSRSGNYDIYAQRVNISGDVQWTADGVALCTATGDQQQSTITSDGAGGAIVTWQDFRSGDYDIYAQRVNASGVVQWIADGVALCTKPGYQSSPTILSDDAGGAIVTWQDFRNGQSDIYTQRVNASGGVQWTTDGVALCMATGNQNTPTITSDGAGGAIATWVDQRRGSYNIYAQMIDSYGRSDYSYLAPGLSSILDVPRDEGGCVRLMIEKSPLDSDAELDYPIAMYNVWQRIDNPALLEAAGGACNLAGSVSAAHATDPVLVEAFDVFRGAGWPIKEADGRYFVQSRELLGIGTLPPGTWELLGSFASSQQDQYIYRARTLQDSTGSGIPYSVYMLSAHATTPSVWFTSDPDSGYSVDNIPPAAPGGLVAEQSFVPIGLKLSWSMNQENDLARYVVYRGSSVNFEPAPGNRIATLIEPQYFDSGWRWNSGYYYRISAIDVHGNESGFALLAPDNVTGNETPDAPFATYLGQNFPNPFNPATRIEFGLKAPANVSLKIYDAAGRVVRVLVEGGRPAGTYAELWDGRDNGDRAVASGIYFYRLDAGTFTQTHKMVLLK